MNKGSMNKQHPAYLQKLHSVGRTKLALLLVCLIPFSLLIAVSTRAQDASKQEIALDSVDLQHFLDEVTQREMTNQHIPGAVVTVVRDGAIVFNKGYGYSDLSKDTPVSSDTTSFRVASVSKILTTLAALQMVEQGKLDLSRDVNNYLKLFQLQSNYAQPVTLANLLTHTGGFDDLTVGETVSSREEQIPLGTYLARRMPPRVLPPGKYYSYSNHGYSLAGYLVEVASGEPFAKYMEENVLLPLEMNHSSYDFRTSLLPNLALGYDWRRGKYVPCSFDYANIAPAVTLITSGTDMAHFMNALLAHGQYKEKRVLSEEMTSKMLEPQYAADPRLPGAAFGFYQGSLGHGYPLIQNGDWIGTASLLVLVPDRNVGFFIALNSEATDATWHVLRDFLERYFPAPPPRTPIIDEPNLKDVSRFEGLYTLDHYSRTTLDKIVRLFRTASVTGKGDGIIEVVTPDTGSLIWTAIDKRLFQAQSNGGLLAFHQDLAGKIDRFFIGHKSYVRLAWYDAPVIHLVLFPLFGVIFASEAFSRLLVRWRERRRGVPETESNLKRQATLWAILLAGGNALFLLLIVGWFPLRERLELDFGTPRLLIAILTIPIVTTIVCLIALGLAVRIWQRKEGSPGWRLRYSLFVVTAIIFIPFLMHWNLLGYHY
jgi:CubicO group peptidase (beta-lactamase class C family)